MMHKQMLLATAAALLLAFPSVSLAQNNPGGPGESDKKGGHPEEGKAEHGKPPQSQAQPQGQPRPQGQAQAQPKPQPQPKHRAEIQPQGQPRPQGSPDQGQARHRAQSQPPGPPPPASQPEHQAQARQPTQPGPRGEPRSDHRVPASVHAEQRDQWRSGHADWNRGTVWQRDRNWWRENAGFRDYRGARPDFYFAPGYGYYSVPRQYWDHSWSVGAFLPAFFLSYAVADYQEYGLPPPPDGCEWVWVNNNVLLVDRSDGYIVDEIDNVWNG